jgi:tetratricopeptide (TPR) repeat protein
MKISNMKNIFIAVFAASVLFACNNKQAPQSSTTSHTNYKRLYEKSMDFKDYPTAIMAIQMMLLEDSTLTAYQDSLPELYAATNNIEACSKTIDVTLSRHPKEEKFLQVKALVQQETGDYAGVFTTYTTLYETTKKLSYLYQIGTLHFSAGKLDEASKTVDLILTKAETSKDSLDIFVNEQQKQKVPILAAALNFRGYIYAQQRNLSEAKVYFEAAIKVFPDFVMAQRNLQQLMSAGKKK